MSGCARSSTMSAAASPRACFAGASFPRARLRVVRRAAVDLRARDVALAMSYLSAARRVAADAARAEQFLERRLVDLARRRHRHFVGSLHDEPQRRNLERGE